MTIRTIRTIRTIIIDDSVVVRRAVANLLAESADIEVVATAADGRRGLERIAELRPDVVTLDVEMPIMDGLATLAEIRREWPSLPVIMYSTLTERGAAATLEALALGAVDYATKPSGVSSRELVSEHVRENLLPLVQLWGVRHARPGSPHAPAHTDRVRTADTGITLRPPGRGPLDLVTIGVSTGGPDALAQVIPVLPGHLAVPVVIVQHMPAVFTAMLAHRLDTLSPLSVSEAADGDLLRAGHVYVAPGGCHTEVHRSATGLRVSLTDGPRENSCRPAVDVLFRTAAQASAGRLLAVVLTGMGQDGLLGTRDVCAAGGSAIAQDEASSVVWGMPGFIARDGLASAVLPLSSIADAVSTAVAGRVAVAAGS